MLIEIKIYRNYEKLYYVLFLSLASICVHLDYIARIINEHSQGGLSYLYTKMSHVTGKSVFGVSDQVRPACSAKQTSLRLEILDIETRDIILSRQRTTTVLIRLCGWHKQIFSWRGLNVIAQIMYGSLLINVTSMVLSTFLHAVGQNEV